MRRLFLWLGVVAIAGTLVLAQDTKEADKADEVKTSFGGDETYDVDYPAAADGKGTFKIGDNATVNLLKGAEGAVQLRNNAVLNVKGGALGLVKSGPSNRLYHQSEVHFYEGALQRRFISMSDEASFTFHGGGDFERLQQLELRSGKPTVTFYLHPEASKPEDVKVVVDRFNGALWTEFDEYLDKDGKLHLEAGTRRDEWRIATGMKITLRLPGDDEPRTIQISVFGENPIRNDENGADSTTNIPHPFFGINKEFLNFDGTIKPGHINFVPADKAAEAEAAAKAAKAAKAAQAESESK